MANKITVLNLYCFPLTESFCSPFCTHEDQQCLKPKCNFTCAWLNCTHTSFVLTEFWVILKVTWYQLALILILH